MPRHMIGSCVRTQSNRFVGCHVELMVEQCRTFLEGPGGFQHCARGREQLGPAAHTRANWQAGIDRKRGLANEHLMLTL
jgi:hypothetical protein